MILDQPTRNAAFPSPCCTAHHPQLTLSRLAHRCRAAFVVLPQAHCKAAGRYDRTGQKHHSYRSWADGACPCNTSVHCGRQIGGVGGKHAHVHGRARHSKSSANRLLHPTESKTYVNTCGCDVICAHTHASCGALATIVCQRRPVACFATRPVVCFFHGVCFHAGSFQATGGHCDL